MIIAAAIGLSIGIILGLVLDISYPTAYSFYITMALLASMDSVLGALRAHMEGKYNNPVFISGFLLNAFLAAALVYLGDRLGVPLYYAVILVFGGRMFQNLAMIRRVLLDKYLQKRKEAKSRNLEKKVQ
ncbi:MAG: small basic family protein [Anaerovoracaceae bacterium]|jgi:small basic protein